MNFRKLCIFDFETDGRDPSVCNPVQLAALVIDARTLKRVKGGKFVTYIRPPKIDDPDYLTDDVRETVEFHAKNYGCGSDEILKRWSEAPTQKHAWQSFVQFINRFNPKNSEFTAPVPCGANIRNFDLPITDRMNKEHNDGKKIFFPRDRVDVQDLAFYWFENLPEPKSYSMDSLRDFFGIDKEGAHDAFKDVLDCEEMIRRWFLLTRKIAAKVKFKNAFTAHATAFEQELGDPAVYAEEE